MRFFYRLILLLLTGFWITACVDDYEDSNPPLPLDAPFSTLTVADDTLVGGESTTFTIKVVDAPGGIDSVGFLTTDDKGQVIIDEASLNAARGQEQGEITGTFIAPFNARGNFTLTLIVYDMQGEQQKSYTLSEDLFIVPAFADPDFTLTASDNEVALGESTTLFIDINAEANIENVRIFASTGTVILDQTSLEGVRGSTSGIVEATYTAPEAPSDDVGPVTFTVFVEDELQDIEESDTFDDVVEVVYAEDEPAITITAPESGNVTVDAQVAVQANGVIDTVIVQAFVNETDEEVGSLTYDIENLIGTTGGEFEVMFNAENYIGYVELVVTVIDEQGASTTETERVLIQPCPINLADTYFTFTDAVASDSCAVGSPVIALQDTVDISGVLANRTRYEVEDITGGAYAFWYGDCVDYSGGESADIIFNCNDNSIQVVPFEDSFGATITGSGSYEPGSGRITINWENDSGASGIVTFTPD